jgi:hypothetical protein
VGLVHIARVGWFSRMCHCGSENSQRSKCGLFGETDVYASFGRLECQVDTDLAA